MSENVHMERTVVVDWLKAYVQAWETYAPEAGGRLVTDDGADSFHP